MSSTEPRTSPISSTAYPKLSRRHLANAIRVLSMDAVQKANSGHPGMPMGMADIAEVLWNDFMHHNPADPTWCNRDRFIISNGHGSMLLYSLLHLTGYDSMTLADIQQFRQLHSKTAGHPEFGLAPGIETTTGPLGQGIANAVGMALAERTLAAQFNQDEWAIVDHYTYVFLGDGCLMEGVSHEACSLAGHLGLGKLIAFWDDNGISIDGQVAGWFTDDTPKRFEAYGWHVISNVDGHDHEHIKRAILQAREVKDKPSLICCKTIIAFGAPNLGGSHKAHGAALGEEEVALARKQLDWHEPPFVIPDEVYAGWNARERGAAQQYAWQVIFSDYKKQHPALASEYKRRIDKQLPGHWAVHVDQFIQATQSQGESLATRKASLNCLNYYGAELPELLGGSADLTGSNLTQWSGCNAITHHCFDGNYIYYGVREFGMFAIMNGIALQGGFVPYGGTFLTFVDYGRNAVRLAAMMRQRVIFVFTHDSIGLGEDGPTHQPVEHIGMLRLTPQLSLWRPCDAVETAVAWRRAIEKIDGPTALLFSRQSLEHQHRDQQQVQNIARGGYVLCDCTGEADIIIIATGSEVELAMKACQKLCQQERKVRVVSMPSTYVFEEQDKAYKESVLPKHIKRRLAIEAGASAIWHQYVGDHGRVVGLDRYGESAPAQAAFEALGFTVEHVLAVVDEMLAQ